MASTFTLIWGALAVVFAAVEAYALMSYKKLKAEGESGDRGTFSWHVWWLRERWWGRVLAVTTWGWAFYHFFFESTGLLAPIWWDDFLLLGGLAGLAVTLKPRGVDGQ